MKEIIELLTASRDEGYAEFQRKLIPNIPPNSIIGVRTPELRKMAREVAKSDLCGSFLAELPHSYFDENQLHAFIISQMKDFDGCVAALEEFLPFIDNWATCDQTSPTVFKKRAEDLLPLIEKWLCSERVYTKRFAIGMLMQHFLDERFEPRFLEMVTSIHSEEYYVNMEIAWYMATALAKQWEAAVPFLENGVMDKWTHNRTIQKARESYRITDEQKEYLKQLKK